MQVEPNAIRMGESAQLVISIEGADRPAPPQIPQLQGLRVGQPTVEQRSSVQIVNGRREYQRADIFRYHLMPMEPGDFEIGPITYTYRNETVTVPAQSLRVVMPTDLGEARSLSDLVFAELSVNRDRVHVQEAFTLTLSIYSRGVNLGREVGLSNLPDTGLRIEPFQELAATQEIIKDDIYDVRRYQTLIRPLTAGAIVFEPRLQVQLLVPRQSRRHPFFDDSFFHGFFSGMEAHPFDLDVTPLEVRVRPLPGAGRPEGFSGGVGSFTFHLRVEETDIRPGDPISIHFLIEGEGNLDAVSSPALEDSELFRVFTPRVAQTDMDRAGQRGRRMFEQVVIPRTAEATELPPISFHYFDPLTGTYRTIVRGPIQLNILEGDATPQRIVRADETDGAGRTRILGQDIRYLKPAPAQWYSVYDTPWYLHPAFLFLQTLPLAWIIGVYRYARRRRVLDADVALARRYRAPRSARPGLRHAETAYRNNDELGFYDGLWTALTSYFADRLNLPTGAVTSDIVLEAMRQQGLDQTSLALLRELFDACEQRRFGQRATDPMRCRDLLTSFRSILKRCGRLPS